MAKSELHTHSSQIEPAAINLLMRGHALAEPALGGGRRMILDVGQEARPALGRESCSRLRRSRTVGDDARKVLTCGRAEFTEP